MSGGLTVHRLAVARGGRLLVGGLDMSVPRGGAAIVTGANGAGKSSLLRVLAGLLRPYAGTIACDDRVAFLGEASALDPERSLVAALTFWARQDGRDAADIRVAAALDAVALTELADVPVRLLSTGQRRRGALARVVASGAGLWLLDEPATGLDRDAVVRLEMLVAGHRAAGGSVVVATHQPSDLPGAAAVRL